MRNIKIKYEYDGTDFFGMQKQEKARTVAGEIEKILNVILKEKINLINSGRTDRGVHALEQVSNFLTESRIPVERLEYALKIAKEREYLDSKKLFDLQKQIDSIKVLADTLEFLQSSHFDTSLVVKDIKYGDINVWYYHPVEKFSLDFFPCSLPEIHVVKYIEKPESWKDNKLLYVILGASGQIVFSKLMNKYID